MAVQRRPPELAPHDLEVMSWACKAMYTPLSLKYRDLCRRLVRKGYLDECAPGAFEITAKGSNKLRRCKYG